MRFSTRNYPKPAFDCVHVAKDAPTTFTRQAFWAKTIEMKRLPDNIADFKTVIEGNYVYADKTKHLHGLITGSGQNFFLARPRRFGKTLLVSTLEQIFLGNRELFKGLWISQSDYAWPKHPIVRLSMAGVNSSTPEQFERSLSLKIERIGAEHGIHFKDDEISSDRFSKLIQELSRNGRVVVLIDEYEHPILTHILNPDVAAQIRDTLKTFYGTLKDLDKNLRFVFLTGVTKFAKTSIFSGINNLTDLSLNTNAATLLGLQPSDLESYFSEHIKAMAHERDVSTSEILGALREWYNGYRFSPRSDFSVYNPCSVLKCLTNREFSNYWFETGTPAFLVNLIKKGNYPVLALENIVLSESDLGTFEVDDILLETLLFQTGYLTIKSYDAKSQTYTLSYPNKEVSESMMGILGPMITQKRSFAPWQILAVKLKDALAVEDLETFCKLLKQFLADVPYTLHIGLEKYYHTIFYMLMKFMGAEIWIEEATNIGRIDAVLQTSTHVYVIEFKLDKSAKEALEQIKRLQYAEKYKLLNKQIVAVGLAFDSEAKNIVDYAWEQTI